MKPHKERHGKNNPLKAHRDGHIYCYKETTANWAPSYRLSSAGCENIMLVLCAFFPLGEKRWRVCAWGNDDTGMEYDTNDKGHAKVVWEAVLKLEDVTPNALKALGFVHA